MYETSAGKARLGRPLRRKPRRIADRRGKRVPGAEINVQIVQAIKKHPINVSLVSNIYGAVHICLQSASIFLR